jgi:hypothetical protein
MLTTAALDPEVLADAIAARDAHLTLDIPLVVADALRRLLAARESEIAALRAELHTARQAAQDSDQLAAAFARATVLAAELAHERDQAEAQRDAALAWTGPTPAAAAYVSAMACLADDDTWLAEQALRAQQERDLAARAAELAEPDEDDGDDWEPSYVSQAEDEYRSLVLGGCR